MPEKQFLKIARDLPGLALAAAPKAETKFSLCLFPGGDSELPRTPPGAPQGPPGRPGGPQASQMAPQMPRTGARLARNATKMTPIRLPSLPDCRARRLPEPPPLHSEQANLEHACSTSRERQKQAKNLPKTRPHPPATKRQKPFGRRCRVSVLNPAPEG